MNKYIQCDLISGSFHTTSWLPIKFAFPGNQIKIGDKDWIVEKTYQIAEFKDIKDIAHNSKDIWEATSGKNPIGHK